MLASQLKGPGFESGSGHCADWIRVYYACGSAASFRWDVKPRPGLRAHAFKNMRGPKRTWMTKRKSRGPETYRYSRHIKPNEVGVKLAAHSTLQTAEVPQCAVWEISRVKAIVYTETRN